MEVCHHCKNPPASPLKCACGLNYCRECYQNLKNYCLNCNTKNQAAFNHDLNNRIESCPKCSKSVFKDPNYILAHERACEKNIISCSACNFTAKRSEVDLHLFNVHYLQILSAYAEPVSRLPK
jgi:hypothetical protein